MTPVMAPFVLFSSLIIFGLCIACCMCSGDMQDHSMACATKVILAKLSYETCLRLTWDFLSECQLCHTDDAVQATKARIEALKKETPVPESPSKDSIPAKPPQARPRPSPSAPDTKGPKKLSDIKVSANIAASLGNIKLSSPAAPASNGSAARSPAAGATAMPAAATAMPTPPTAAPSHMDLLGGLDAPAPASSQLGSGEAALLLSMMRHGTCANGTCGKSVEHANLCMQSVHLFPQHARRCWPGVGSLLEVV